MKMYAYIKVVDTLAIGIKDLMVNHYDWTTSQNMLCQYQDALWSLDETLDKFRDEKVYKQQPSQIYQIIKQYDYHFSKNPTGSIMRVKFMYPPYQEQFIIVLFAGMGTRLGTDTFTILRAMKFGES